MGRIYWKVKTLLGAFARGDFSTPLARIRNWIDSNTYVYCLRRNLTVPYPVPPAKVPLIVRELQPEDLPALFDSGGSALELHDLRSRKEFVRVHPNRCFVAVTQERTPCFMQWLITPEENEKNREYFGGFYPWLAPDEVLLEQTYTVKSFRRMGIMTHAMSKIAERGIGFGARWALTFVSPDNIRAMRGTLHAGFRPYRIRRLRWRWFYRRISFEPLPNSDVMYHLKEPAPVFRPSRQG